ncbi:MAG: hypothetical protein GX111_05745 [Clostridiales bacterium]|jgi:hypothetical protein|nr:hypothetical protein [Clostridiales bacterium]
MYNKRRIRFTAALFAVLLCTSFIGNVYAVNDTVYSERASYYLDYYDAWATASSRHTVVISFDVDATGIMDVVGASYIVIQENNNGVWSGVASFFGSSTIGMLAYNTNSHTGSVSCTGTVGKQYRALVTIYAEDDSGSDSRTVTTSTVTAS